MKERKWTGMTTRVEQGTPETGEECVLGESRSDWLSARLLVRHEGASRARAWSDLHKHHTIIVNLCCAIDRFEAVLDDGTRSLQPPTPGYMSIIPSGRAFSGELQGRGNSYAVWTISAERLARVAAEAGLVGPIEILPRLSHRDTAIYDAILRLAAICGRTDDVARLDGDAVSRWLGLHLATAYDARAMRLPPRVKTQILSRSAIARLQEHIDAHLAEKIALEDLAFIAGETVHNLLLGFRQRFGTTPHRYLIEQRLRRASWQLAHTDKPIAAIAYDAGFSSQSHLTTAFVSAFAVTPAAYRRDLR